MGKCGCGVVVAHGPRYGMLWVFEYGENQVSVVDIFVVHLFFKYKVLVRVDDSNCIWSGPLLV